MYPPVALKDYTTQILGWMARPSQQVFFFFFRGEGGWDGNFPWGEFLKWGQ